MKAHTESSVGICEKSQTCGSAGKNALEQNLERSDSRTFPDVIYSKCIYFYTTQPLKVFMYMPKKSPKYVKFIF